MELTWGGGGPGVGWYISVNPDSGSHINVSIRVEVRQLSWVLYTTGMIGLHDTVGGAGLFSVFSLSLSVFLTWSLSVYVCFLLLLSLSVLVCLCLSLGLCLFMSVFLSYCLYSVSVCLSIYFFSLSLFACLSVSFLFFCNTISLRTMTSKDLGYKRLNIFFLLLQMTSIQTPHLHPH